MGKFQVGILGGFEGKVGTVVGARWRGIEYMRHKGRKPTKPATLAQDEHRAKFAILTKFIHKFSILLMQSFKGGTRITPINEAFAFNFEKAISGSFPAFAIDYSKVALSKGELQNAGLPTASAAGSGTIKWDWQDNSGDTLADAADNAVLISYCPETAQAILNMQGPRRDTKSGALNVANFTGKTVHTWISFVSGDGTEFATSIYTGEVVVS